MKHADYACILDLLNSGIYDELASGYRDEFRWGRGIDEFRWGRGIDEFRWGRGIGIQRGVEKTLKALGYAVDWEEDGDGNPVAAGISEVA